MTVDEEKEKGTPERRFHTSPPLAVDLDGTLVKTDLLIESIVALLREAPWQIFSLPMWLLKGRAYLKAQVARRVSVGVETLPYRRGLLDYLESQHTRGRRLILATAADETIAREIAVHLGIFDLVLASDGRTNLCGERKRDRLVAALGENGFDYAGNAIEDLPVWAAARRAIAVDPGRRVRSKISGVAESSCGFEDAKAPVWACVGALRPHHWIKNLLLFAPALAAHRMHESPLVLTLLAAFFSFGCIASSGYLVNDVLDVASDRNHPNKRLRPFASGQLSLTYALAMIPILFAMGCIAGWLVSSLFLAAALSYFGLSIGYSLHVRKVAILDVIFLASLYTLRILAGAAAVTIWPSHWLLAFSTFLFFSMALVKRYGELAIMKRVNGDGAKARGYELSDGELLASMGVSSGYLAVLVLALYINSDKAQTLYTHYQLMWLLCLLLLYWISHVWLIAHRGLMPDDPVVFALHDRTSWILVALIAVIIALAV